MITQANSYKADCHCHTHYSDGSFSVDALLALAKSSGLAGLSITDHDTLAAYPEALPLAKVLEIDLVSGIEISTQHQGASIHVLGYAFDLQNPEILAFCQQQQIDRHERNLKILERLNAHKKPISLQELLSRFGQGTQGRPHIAQLMLEKGYVSSFKEAFDRFLGEGKCCYVAGFDVSVETAIHIIHAAGGYAVLAHPHYIEPKRIVKALLNLPFDGLEVFYGNLLPAQEKPWLDIAKKKDWIMTGGSDFHGEKKSYQKLGCSFTPSEYFAIFKQRFAQHQTAHPQENTLN